VLRSLTSMARAAETRRSDSDRSGSRLAVTALDHAQFLAPRSDDNIPWTPPFSLLTIVLS